MHGILSVSEVRTAALVAHTAASDIDEGVARTFARAAGHAAANSHVACHAIHSANYVVATVNTNKRIW